MSTIREVVDVVCEFVGPVAVLFNPKNTENAEFLRRYDEIRQSVRVELGLTEGQLASIDGQTQLPVAAQEKFDELTVWLERKQPVSAHAFSGL